MREMDAFEQAYKNGFAAGMKAAEEKIVRCKECKDYEYGECVCQYKVMSDCAHYYPDEDDFCNYGERREDGR